MDWGSVARRSEQNAAENLKSSDKRNNHVDRMFYDAVKRFNIMFSGHVHDIFALDLYYHHKRYRNFTYRYEKKAVSVDEELIVKQQALVMDSFMNIVQRKVIQDNEAYYLADLLVNLREISDEHGLHEPPIIHSSYTQVLLRLNSTKDFLVTLISTLLESEM